METKREKLIAAKVSENLYEDFRIECINRGLSVKQALSQAINAWMLTKPDQKSLPITTFRLIQKKAKIKKIKANG